MRLNLAQLFILPTAFILFALWLDCNPPAIRARFLSPLLGLIRELTEPSAEPLVDIGSN